MANSGKAAKDFKFRDQIRGASLNETRNLLHEGRAKKYFKPEDVEKLLRLQARAAKAALRLIQYLEGLPDDFIPFGGAEPEPRT